MATPVMNSNTQGTDSRKRKARDVKNYEGSTSTEQMRADRAMRRSSNDSSSSNDMMEFLVPSFCPWNEPCENSLNDNVENLQGALDESRYHHISGPESLEEGQGESSGLSNDELSEGESDVVDVLHELFSTRDKPLSIALKCLGIDGFATNGRFMAVINDRYHRQEKQIENMRAENLALQHQLSSYINDQEN